MAEVERATRSGNYALPTLDEDEDESIDALDEGALPVPELGSAPPAADAPELAELTEASPVPVERPRVVVPRPAPFEPSEPPPAAVLADPASRVAVLPPKNDEGSEPSPPAEQTVSAPSSAPPQAVSSEAPGGAELDSSTPAEVSNAAPETAPAPTPPEADASGATPETAPAPSAADGAIAADSSSSDEEEEDGADLAPERRERIAELYFAIELMDHYDVLGVAKDAKRKEIRTAYFALSKQFHPDTMFRKRLGTYKAKMEAIFHRLTEAYDVLGKKKPRAEYDRYLGLLDRTRSVEETISEAPEPEPAPAVEPEPAPTPPADSPLPETTRSSAAAIARRRQLMAEKLRRAARASSAVSIRTIPPSDDDALLAAEIPAAQRRDSVLQSLKRGLRESAVQTGGPDPIRRHLSDARRHEDGDRLEEAMASLRFAAAIDPTQAEVSAELKRVTARLAASLAETYEAQARYEQEHGKWAAAAISWARVFEGRPDDADAARNAADAIVSANGDLRKARQLAQSAFELAPSDLPVLRTLARVYLSAGLETSARGVLERALELEPDDPAVRALVARLEG